jgi:hypothetical protein
MIWLGKIWRGAAMAVALEVAACSGTDRLVGSDGSTGGLAGGGGSAGTLAASETGGQPTGNGGGAALALGEACLPDDELSADFAGFNAREVNVADQFQGCASKVCVVNHFQGRVSCPYGQSAADGGCLVPSTATPVSASVQPQLAARQAAQAVTCSCQCAGYGPGPYCTCPTSMVCEHLIDYLDVADTDGAPPKLNAYAGSYCIPAGAEYDSSQLDRVCSEPNCGAAHPY